MFLGSLCSTPHPPFHFTHNNPCKWCTRHANTQPGGKPGLLLQRRTTPPTTRKHTKLYRHQHRPRGHTEQTGNNTPTFSTTTSGAPAPQAADKSKHSHTNPNLPFNTQTTTSDSITTTPNQCHPRNGTTHLGHYPSFATPLVLSTGLKGGRLRRDHVSGCSSGGRQVFAYPACSLDGAQGVGGCAEIMFRGVRVGVGRCCPTLLVVSAGLKGWVVALRSRFGVFEWG